MSYIIVGGLGGFGLELADRLVLRGCKKLVLSSSRGVTESYQKDRIATFKSYGAEVIVSTAEITTLDGCRKLISEANTLGPVGGIFNLAARLRDAILENQDKNTFAECLAPKTLATHYLDAVSREMCPKLEHFVVFSSVSCGRGNAGQSNYGMANSVMERIVENRHANGLPGKAIQWGAIGDVGMLADSAGDMSIGVAKQSILSCLDELDVLLTTSAPVVSSMVLSEKKSATAESQKVGIVEAIAGVMGLKDIKSISVNSKLSELGMDSLVATEIRQLLEKDFEVYLSPDEVRWLTFSKLQDLAENKSSGKELEPGGFRTLGDESINQEMILKIRENENDPIILVPGVIGIADKAITILAERLVEHSVYIAQCTQTADLGTLREVAEAIFKEARVLFTNKPFYIAGYSLGAIIAVELVRLFEENSMKGFLFLIDSSPVFCKQFVRQVSNIHHPKLQEGIELACLSQIISIRFKGQEMQHAMKTILAIDGFEKRVKKFTELAAGDKEFNYSSEYLRKILIGSYNRMKFSLEYDDTGSLRKLQSNALLVRAQKASLPDIVEDYGVREITNGTVILKRIEGDHLEITENPDLAKMIQEYAPGKTNAIQND